MATCWYHVVFVILYRFMSTFCNQCNSKSETTLKKDNLILVFFPSCTLLHGIRQIKYSHSTQNNILLNNFKNEWILLGLLGLIRYTCYSWSCDNPIFVKFIMFMFYWACQKGYHSHGVARDCTIMRVVSNMLSLSCVNGMDKQGLHKIVQEYHINW